MTSSSWRPPEAVTLVGLLEERADTAADHLAYARIGDSGEVVASCTYRELRDGAARLAARLSEHAEVRSRVLLIDSDPMIFVQAFFATLMAGLVPVPASGPTTPASRHRLAAQTADCKPVIVLGRPTDLSRLDDMTQAVSSEPPLDGPELVRPAFAQDTALLQYTSGSTNDPRGVVVTHRSMLANQRSIALGFEHDRTTVFANWLPAFHDMGLIGGILQPLYLGVPSYLMTPVQFLRDPGLWLNVIGRYGVTSTGGPNFAYDLCVDRVTAEKRDALDLRTWRVAFNGAEPVRIETLRRFAAAFAPAGLDPGALHPCYGLAEATLLVASSRTGQVPLAADGGQSLHPPHSALVADSHMSYVSCGPVTPGMTVAVVDPATRHRVPAGEEGEIWVSGPSVGPGYWNRSGDPAFDAHLVQDPDRPYLRTGDLGFMRDGELYVTGRIKDLIIVKGLNVHPADVEAAAATVIGPRVGHRASAAFENRSRPDDVVLLIEGRIDHDELDGLVAGVRRAVAARCGIDLAVVGFLGTTKLPRTTSGKVRRRQVATDFASNRLAPSRQAVPQTLGGPGHEGDGECAPTDRALPAVRHALEDCSADIRWEEDHALSPADIGLESLDAARVAAAVNRQLGTRVTATDVLSCESLDDFVRTVSEDMVRPRATDNHAWGATVEGALAQSSAEGGRPLSATAQAMAVLAERYPERTSENLSVAFLLRDHHSDQRCRRAAEAITERHPALRSSVVNTPLGMRALALAGADVWHPPAAACSNIQEAVDEFANIPFDLAGPPCRVTVHWTTSGERAAQLVVHHIAADQRAMSIVVVDFLRALEGEILPSLPHPITEPTQVPPSGNMDYWRSVFPEPPTRAIVPGRPVSPRGGATGRAVARRIEGGDHAIRAVAKDLQVTPATVQLAAWLGALRLHTARERVIVSVPFDHRGAQSESVGCHITALPVVVDIQTDDSFRSIVAATAARLLELHPRCQSPAPPEVLGTSTNGRGAELQFGFSPFQDPPDGSPPTVLGLRGLGLVLSTDETDLTTLTPTRFGPSADLLLSTARHQGDLLATLEFDTSVTDHTAAACMLDTWYTLLDRLTADPELMSRPLSDVDGRTVNSSPVTQAPEHLPLEVIRSVARTRPDAVAVEAPDSALTYAELLDLADRGGGLLRERGVLDGDRVLVHCSAGPAVVVAMLAVWSAGAVYCPLDSRLPDRRRGLIRETAQAKCEIDADEVLAACRTRPSVSAVPDCATGLEDAAYVIFTSGSTGSPKGALVSHLGLANTMRAQGIFGIGLGQRVLQACSLGFDASIFEIVLALGTGATLIVDGSQVQDLTKSLHTRAVDVLVSPPTVVSTVNTDELPGLVVLAGEPCPPDLVALLAGRCRLFNAYGPTECAIWTSIEPLPESDSWPVIGRAVEGVTLSAVDASGRRLPPYAPGELCIGGHSVGIGYLNDPATTAARFRNATSGRVYLTGDRGYELPDGRFAFIDRIDRQVKIHGVRIELAEVEQALRIQLGARDAAAVVIGVDADATIGAVVVRDPDQPTSSGALRDGVRRVLPSPAVPSTVVLVDHLPTSASGKIDTVAVARLLDRERPPSVRGGEGFRTTTERAIAAICRDVVGRDPGGRDVDLLSAGVNSLNAARLCGRLAEHLDRPLRVALLYAHPVLAEFAAAVDALPPAPTASPGRATSSDTRGLGPIQRDIWLREQVGPADGAYDVPLVFEVRGDLDLEGLTSAMDRLVAAHPGLRTRVELVNGEPVLRVEPPPASSSTVHVEDLADDRDPRARAHEALGDILADPPDLDRVPNVRVHAFRIADDVHILALVGHHLFLDGWSVGILLDDLGTAYAGQVLQSTSLPRAAGETNDPAVLGRWHQRFRDFDPSEPYVPDTAAIVSAIGATRAATTTYTEIVLPAAAVRTVRDSARQASTTPFVVLTALFGQVVSRQQGRDDVVVSVVDAHRELTDDLRRIDCSATMVPLRLRYPPEASAQHQVEQARDALAQVRADIGPALSQIGMSLQSQHLARSPFLDALAVQVDPAFTRLNLPGLDVSPVPWRFGAAKAGLLLEVEDDGENLRLRLEADASIFTAKRADRVAAAVVDAAQYLEDPAHLAFRLAHDEHELIERFNHTAYSHDLTVSVPELVRQAATRFSEETAVEHAGGARVSYAEFDRRVARVAGALRGHGVGPGIIVGALCRPGVDLLVAVHAIMRAGGAYLALDPTLPVARLHWMIDDVDLGIVVTSEAGLAGLLPDGITTIGTVVKGSLDDGHLTPVAPEDPAYVLYTSGSTGQPKAVVNTHAGLANRLHWMQRVFALQPGERVVQKTTFTFDVSVWELFWPLMVGATVCTLDPDEALDLDAVRRLLAEREITIAHFVPSTFDEILRHRGPATPGLRAVVLSGEAVAPDMLERGTTEFGCGIHNLYGPTEAAIDVTHWPPAPAGRAGPVPIGRPIDNMRVDIVDMHGRSAPIGTPGEIVLSGVGLASGYLNRPDLTAQAFAPLPGRADRAYRTGDVGRWTDDGTIEFLGRHDDQVKIAGVRVEPSEVAAAIRYHLGAAEAVVRAHGAGLDRHLVATVAPGDDALPSESDMRRELAAILPRALVPRHLVVVERLPRLPNGKINTSALPTPGPDPERLVRLTRATSEKEAAVLEIWRAVLGREDVGVTDNFFDVGGNSALLMILQARLVTDLGWSGPIVELLGAPTVRGQSALIEGADPALRTSPGQARDATGPKNLGILALARARGRADPRR